MSQQDEETASYSAAHTGFGWVKLLRWATAVAIIVVIFINLVAGVIPPLVVFVLLWIGGFVWLRRSTKGPAILLLVSFIAFIATSAPFVIPTLTVPSSAGDFLTTIASFGAAIVGIVAAISVLRRRHETMSGTPRTLGLVAVGLLVVAIAVSVISTLGYQEPAAQEGDIALTTENIEFSETSLDAEAGEISVFVDNADGTLHTFTIDELDVNLAIPASKSARITFQAEPGTYEFYCAPHKEDMEGTLEVR